MMSNTSVISVGISLPREILQQIDEQRKDISRSRFILRLLEKSFPSNHTPKPKTPLSEFEEAMI